MHFGTDKTHMTDSNLRDSEQAIDLINAYELKLRKDFTSRYNAWKGSEALSVEIHNITQKTPYSATREVLTMTMNDLKTAAVEEFNKYVLDDYAREYFSDAFDLWEDEPSEYSSINNGYKVVIKRYVQKINVEVEKYVAIMREYTKLTTSESSSSDEELSASKKVLDSATNRHRRRIYTNTARLPNRLHRQH